MLLIFYFVILYVNPVQVFQVNVCPNFHWEPVFYQRGLPKYAEKDMENKYSLAASLRSNRYQPYDRKWSCGTTTWIETDGLTIVVVESNLPHKDTIKFDINTEGHYYLKFKLENYTKYWYFFAECDSKDVFALLGTTHSIIIVTDTKRVLEKWQLYLNVTEMGVEDFDYSSGICNHWINVKSIIWYGWFILVIVLLVISIFFFVKSKFKLNSQYFCSTKNKNQNLFSSLIVVNKINNFLFLFGVCTNCTLYCRL